MKEELLLLVGRFMVTSNPLASVLLFRLVGQEDDLRLLIYHSCNSANGHSMQRARKVKLGKLWISVGIVAAD